MSRELPEWVGKTDDSKIPPRVRLRVFYRDNGICQCGCGRLIHAGERWQTDHIVALINGGQNRETNLRTLLVKCHKVKTAEDVKQKAKNDRVRKRHLGIKKPSRFSCSRDSKFKKKIDGSVVLR